jgi:predicted secreted protein
MMATLTGNNGQITIAGTGVLNVRNFSCDITSDTIEETTMLDDTRQYLKGLSSWSGSADVYVDTANLTGGASAIGQLITTGGTVGDSGAAVVLALDSSGGTLLKKLSGTAIITGFTINSSMDGMVEGSISFQGSGAVTYSAT